MVGKFFHSYKNGILEWQGRIIDRVGSQFLIQLYEWIGGTPSDQVIVSPECMQGWKFYDDQNDWLLAYEKYAARQTR